MSNLDDVLGAQQDQLAEYGFQFSQLIQNSPAFKGCTSPFEVFCRIHETAGAVEGRKVLGNYLTGIHTEFRDIDVWVERLLSSVVHKDAVEFNAVSERAIWATVCGGGA
ncbi:MAG: hypothetical protein WKF77_20225 [Planctomycetaceae bacterium]